MPPQQRQCPFCGEVILAAAKKCKHCGEFLDGSARPPTQPPVDKKVLSELRAEYRALEAERQKANKLSLVYAVIAIIFNISSIVPGIRPLFPLLITASIICSVIAGVHFAKYRGRGAAWGLLGLGGICFIVFIACVKDIAKERMLEIKLRLDALGEKIS